ncbi:hypothetical protein ACFL2Q_13910 [Thermodesulfobacteriota bacterium]
MKRSITIILYLILSVLMALPHWTDACCCGYSVECREHFQSASHCDDTHGLHPVADLAIDGDDRTCRCPAGPEMLPNKSSAFNSETPRQRIATNSGGSALPEYRSSLETAPVPDSTQLNRHKGRDLLTLQCTIIC